MHSCSLLRWSCAALLSLVLSVALAQEQEWQDAQPRVAGQGVGPFKRLVIKNAMLVRGHGMPASGPLTVVIEGNRIVSNDGFAARADDHVIDATGMYVVPGLIDTHVRLIDSGYDDLPPDYGMKLLLAHGVTTIASMQDFSRIDWALRLQKQSAANTIVAPRVQVWADVSGDSPEEIRANVRTARKRGVFGIGEGSVYTGNVAVMRAGLDEAKKLGMRSHWHMSSLVAPQFNALDAARAGLNGLAHWYCLPETLFEGKTLPTYPKGYNSNDTRQRFAEAGRLWKQTAPPHSPTWNRVIDEFRALDFTFEPTFSVYEAHRDYMRVSRAEWHDDYLHPVLEKTFIPGKTGRFSHFYDWTSSDEIEWQNNFRLWMAFVNEYKNRGGRVVAGTDAGFMWVNFGFGLIRNMEMLQEAGFSTLEVLDAATVNGAEHLGMQASLGSIEPGKLADLAIVDGDPLSDLKAFYATGTLRLQPDGTSRKQGGVRYTIKDGIVYDARALIDEVAQMVRDARGKQVVQR
ncbi:amidohydrolase family protein [Steroidobacter sp.]|uniref:amidohydrolase family protein n=1 Tax=Steroidobacter sp. TaxID=1978227 RepID=UPI001A5CC52A|nr:amidohydrolase family protein [Steroidobacter sp.]MBL8271769.1 amidohydrolase family protein [Steroidobacter sp.]